MIFYEMYKSIIDEIDKIDSKEKQFEEMFLLITALIYNISCGGKQLDTILTLLKEFDYEKNFNAKKEGE